VENGEGQAERLDQLLLVEPERLEVRPGRDHEHAVAAVTRPVRSPTAGEAAGSKRDGTASRTFAKPKAA
jgi:hypothetical protein